MIVLGLSEPLWVNHQRFEFIFIFISLALNYPETPSAIALRKRMLRRHMRNVMRGVNMRIPAVIGRSKRMKPNRLLLEYTRFWRVIR